MNVAKRKPKAPAKVPEWLLAASVDAARAQGLARELDRWAARMVAEKTTPEDRAKLAAMVRKLEKVRLGLDARREMDRDALERELVAGACRDIATNAKRWRKAGVCLDEEPIARATHMAVGLLSDRLPEHKDALATNIEKVTALIRAHLENRGGRGKRPQVSAATALETLLAALKMHATPSTLKRTATRRRKPPAR